MERHRDRDVGPDEHQAVGRYSRWGKATSVYTVAQKGREMSTTGFLFGMFVTWAAIGIVSAIVMGRRGHAPFSWLILGTVLGPLVIPLALSRGRQVRELLTDRLPASSWQGPVDVLVGIDGSAESIRAAEVVGALLGDRVGRFTLAQVVNYDTALGVAPPADRAANAELMGVVDRVQNHLPQAPTMVVLFGSPAEALIAHAADGQFDVLAVGSRGRGASKLIMGSVATRLSHGAPTPVLIVSGNGEAPPNVP